MNRFFSTQPQAAADCTLPDEAGLLERCWVVVLLCMFVLTPQATAETLEDAESSAPTVIVRGRTQVEGLSTYLLESERGPQTLLTARMVDQDMSIPIAGIPVDIRAHCKGEFKKSFKVITNSAGRWVLSLPPCPGNIVMEIQPAPDAPYVLPGKSEFKLFGGRSNLRLEVNAPSSVPAEKGKFEIQVKAERDLMTDSIMDTGDLAHTLETTRTERVPAAGQPVYLETKERNLKMSGKTDSLGYARFELDSTKMGEPGVIDFTVYTEASRLMNPAMIAFVIALFTSPEVTLGSNKNEARRDESLILEGSVTDYNGPVKGVRVAIFSDRTVLAETATDPRGRFSTRLNLSRLTPGDKILKARLVPPGPWMRAAVSDPLKIKIHAIKPVPILFLIVPLLLTAVLVAGLAAIRRKPWKRLFSGSRDAQKRKPSVTLGRTRISSLIGNGIYSIRGKVVDIREDKPIAKVNINIFSHDDGIEDAKIESLVSQEMDSLEPVETAVSAAGGDFGTSRLKAGSYLVAFHAEGYMGKAVRVHVPHRGGFEGFTVRLSAIRDEVMRLYLEEVEKWLEKRSLLGILTPREILDRISSGWQKPNKEAFRITSLVERTFYSPEIPDKEVLGELQALLDELPKDFGRTSGTGDKKKDDETGSFTVDSGRVDAPLSPRNTVD